MKDRVLVVGADTEFPVSLRQNVGEYYNVDSVSSGDECLKYVNQKVPYIIFLAINMPVMNGFQVCAKLKADASTKDIPVIFSTQVDSMENRLACYDIGGTDVVNKALDAEELRVKLKIIAEENKKRLACKHDVSMANNTADVALSSARELEIVMHFLKQSFSCSSYEKITDNILHSLAEYRLSGSVQIRVVGETIDKNDENAWSPLESKIIARLSTRGRVVEVKGRLLFNCDHVSVLIKNIPNDDPEFVGRLKDNFSLLSEGADSRIRAITAHQGLLTQHAVLKDLTNTAKHAIHHVGVRHHDNKLLHADNMNEMVQQIEDMFSSFGLTEKQEDALRSIVQDAVNETISIYDDGMGFDRQLSRIFDEAKKLMDRPEFINENVGSKRT